MNDLRRRGSLRVQKEISLRERNGQYRRRTGLWEVMAESSPPRGHDL